MVAAASNQLTRPSRRSTTSAITIPVVNQTMAQIVGMEPDEPESVHVLEARAALSRHAAMRGKTLNRRAWHAIKVRLADARLQLTVGMCPGEALKTPYVAELLTAELNAGWQCCGWRAPSARCCEAMADVSGAARVSWVPTVDAVAF